MSALLEALDFDLPRELAAHDPPEAEGRRRDEVRLMLAPGGGDDVRHLAFRDLPDLLAPGDVLVVNDSATLPAALPGTGPRGELLRLHLSTPAPPGAGPRGAWIVEPRLPRGAASLPYAGVEAGADHALPAGGSARLLGPVHAGRPRLWLAALTLPEPLLAYLERHGAPIRYGPVTRPWPIAAYRTMFAWEPGSAEMPSATRPFTAEVVAALRARGVGLVAVTLHAGVSSPEAGEPPSAERWRVSPATALTIAAARAGGGRVVAGGTTVVRALEAAVGDDGEVAAGGGWTDLVVSPERGVRAIDGLLTGWHDPRASHLLMLEAIAGRPLLERSYEAALAHRYRWHEFGDLHLILPGPDRGPRARG